MNQELLKQLRHILAYHKISGIEAYPLDEGISWFLQADRQTAPKATGSEETAAVENQNSVAKVQPAGTIVEIAEEVRLCKSCSLFRKRILPVPGVGQEKVRLFLVGGWLTVDEEQERTNIVFGVEEDLMVERMLKAIDISRSAAFVSNIIKCGIDPSVQPLAENISACASYLYRQIAATEPDVICTMGIVATRAVLHISQPLSQLRGRFHKYHIDDGKQVPVMPTYHPSYLLKNPEMKKATWNDLQMIAKELGKPGR